MKLWFVTGSQHLYGPEALAQVRENSAKVVEALRPALPLGLELQPLITDPEGARQLALAANADSECAGLILWMHTFSPAKMWIGGLTRLQKPFLHLHTQFNEALPWESIDMDFMNLNQAAHGDREAGHLHTRLGLKRKVVVGHWAHFKVQNNIADWARVARAWADWQRAKFARFGDNMRQVAVAEGDKVSAEAQFGFTVDGFGVGDLVAQMAKINDAEIDALVAEYQDLYEVVTDRHETLRDAARQELAIRRFLETGGYRGFTTTFEDLHGLQQLPGLACQRLMAQGYGFGAEGDWKTAALLRAWKTMASTGTSFMEDYTYHLVEGEEVVLGAHMLEICPSIAAEKPRLEVHPLGIGGKADPARLVFDARCGEATNASLIDLGDRFRLIVNEVEAVPVPPMPKLPVARAVWKVKPNFAEGVAAWIEAGGAHHTAYSYGVTAEMAADFAAMAGIECIVIGENGVNSRRG